MVRLVDNARDTAVFVYSSPALRDFCRSPVAENRDRSMTTELDLRDVDSWAANIRESIGHDVRALRAQITGLTKVERMFRTEGYRGKRY